MSYFDLYLTRINAETNQSLNDIADRFEQMKNDTIDIFKQSIKINDIKDATVIVEQITNSDDKRIYTSVYDEIKLGFYITYQNKKWIIINYPELVCNAYWRAKMRMCNDVLTLQTGVTRVQIGTDSLGRPVYQETKQYTSWDCIVSQKSLNISNTNDSIILPEGRISIIIPYIDNPAISENVEFDMFGDTYKIIGIDKTNVIDSNGIFILLCQRVI
jgi:hypothetical protein